MNEPELMKADEHGGRALERVKLGVFLGRVIGAFVGSGFGVILGVWVGWSAAPVIGAIAGVFAGAHFSDFVFRAFPRLSPELTITVGAAARGVSGLFFGSIVGDIVGTFTSLDRLYTVLVGAALGLYVGVVFGNARRGKRIAHAGQRARRTEQNGDQ